MKRIISFLFFIVTSYHSWTQSIYYSSHNRISVDSLKTVIGEFNLSNCITQELYVDTTLSTNGYHEWLDIAFCPDGSIYGLGQDGIYLIDLVNQNHTKLLDGPGSPTQRWNKGMTCTKDSVLIFGERDIFSYEINTQKLVHHGRMTGSMNIWSNIFWLNGQLMSTNNFQIVQIDLQNPANSQIYCDLPISGFLSFTEVAISCDSVAIFGFHSSGDIYLINSSDCSITYYCSISHAINENFQGSAPAFMFMPPPPCAIHVDLDQEDRTLPGIDCQDTILCSLPDRFIFTIPDLFCDKPWDSLLVWIQEGPPGVFLDGNTPSFATLAGQQTDQLRYTSAGSTDFSLLSSYINQLRLIGDVPEGISRLKIGFCGWAKHLVSDTAYAFITLVGSTTSAGKDDSMKICLSDPLIYLPQLLSANATMGGKWFPILSESDFFNPNKDKPGTYHYVVDDPYCRPDTADFLIGTYPIPNFDLGPDRLLCPGDTARIDIDLSNVEFRWSDGSIESKIEIIKPQTVAVFITDEFGCNYSDSTNVLFDDKCLIDEIYIPNIFSPDGNGINDDWEIEENPGVLSMELFIFDRWGNMLFHQMGQSLTWNGISNGNKIIPTGVYVYKINILTTNHNNIIKAGSVMLIR
ncbi:MAG: gliding motility-associated C-terminal domain-containing protein [Saprospiraceae bacterium]